MDEQLKEIIRKITKFRDERDWVRFHDPKNLAEAISIEAGELLENFLWLSVEQASMLDEKKIVKIKEEIADVVIFTLYLCDVLKIDLLAEIEKKILLNAEKYSLDKAKGTAKKYDEL
jgi:NTP pyrophosphatase (non-canonical NTP hydrolase)